VVIVMRMPLGVKVLFLVRVPFVSLQLVVVGILATPVGWVCLLEKFLSLGVWVIGTWFDLTSSR